MTHRKTRSREGWTRVRFGDVVTNVNDQPKRVSLPLATRYVAGEHVDESRLRIDRWGTLGDELVPPTFRRRFGPSDVLFHSRNLKKIAVPDFGGITGEKLFVLRSTSPHLLQDFLPYVLLSPAFTTYAESSWSGSVNKFLNWTPLAKYDFDLPPVEEQRRLAAILLARQNYTHSLITIRHVSAMTIRSSIDHLFHTALSLDRGAAASHWEISSRLITLGTLCGNEIVSGTTPRTGRDQSTGVPFIRVQHLSSKGPMAFENSPSFISRAVATAVSPRLFVDTGDILMNIVGPPMGKLGTVPTSLKGALINQAIARFRTAAEDRTVLLAWLRSSICQTWFHQHSTKTSGQRNINISTCQRAPVPRPTRELRQRTLELLEQERLFETILSDRVNCVASLPILF